MHDQLSRTRVIVDMLPIPPDYLYVELKGFTAWEPNDSLLEAEAYVIPIPIAKKREKAHYQGLGTTNPGQGSCC